MAGSGSVLTLERALDSASRGVISLEQFPVHSDFTFAVGLEGFLLVCPHCHIRLGDFRALLREVAATDPLHPPALVRVIQEVENSDDSRACYYSLKESLTTSREPVGDSIVQSGRIFKLPFARVVGCIPQPADFDICSRKLTGLRQRKALQYFSFAVNHPTVPVTFVNNDPEEEPNSAKRSKLHRDQADAFKEGQSQYCQTAAKGLQQAVLINGQIKQDREMACTDGLLSDVVARHPFRPIEILEAGHMRFSDESPVVKSRRQMLIHALQLAQSLSCFLG